MRRMAVLAIVLSSGASGAALAAPPSPPPSPPAATAEALAEAAFLPDAGPGAGDLDAERLFGHDSFAPGVGLFRWNGGGELELGANSLKISVGTLRLAPGGLPLAGARADLERQAYDVTYVRQWPRGFSLGPLAVDVAPHAGVGLDSYGAGSAEAGATVHLSKADLAAQRLKALGVKDGASFGDKGRWYIFAAASGRAVGLNMLHGEGGWDRAGWSTDATSRLVGKEQVGVGWRKGPMQTSVGFIHRDTKGEHLMYGVDPKSESMVAFSFSIRPH
jgi:hypothetical protein